MKIQATIVADSLSPQNHRLTTLLITFPRFILAELNTHRMLSKNSASSRAIPFEKMVKSARINPFIPIAWQKEHKGMQGTEYWANEVLPSKIKYIDQLQTEWLEARNLAIQQAEALGYGGATKQLANRLLEPFMWHTVLISGTEWQNFFELRCPQYYYDDENIFRSRKNWMNYNYHLPKDRIKNYILPVTEIDWLQINKGQAEIHMMALAEAIWDTMNESKPKQLKAGEWHIPFEDKINLYKVRSVINDDGYEATDNVLKIRYLPQLVKISTAMAARTSYTIVGDEKEVSYETLIGIHDRIINAKPMHSSPMEHCSKAMNENEYLSNIKGIRDDENIFDDNSLGWCRNYRGFIQYRHILESRI